MRRLGRSSLLVVMVGAALGSWAPSAAQAFGIKKFVAINCKVESCGGEEREFTEGASEPGVKYSFPKTPLASEAFTVAGGRVPYGITDFQVKTVGTFPAEVPEGVESKSLKGVVTHIRTDVAAGLATNPGSVKVQCGAEAGESLGEENALVKHELFEAPTCNAESDIGENQVVVYVEGAGDVAIQGKVYDLVQAPGLASEFGVALELPVALTGGELKKAFEQNPIGEPYEKVLEEKHYYAHTFIKGNVEWGKQAAGTDAGDYHDYFEIDVSPSLPLIASRLVFYGTAGENENLITNATACPGDNTTQIRLTSGAEEQASETYTTPVGLEECNYVPFEPSFTLAQSAFAHDEAVGLTTMLEVPQYSPEDEEEPNSSELKTAKIVLPEGMTLNPAAASVLKACTLAQARIHSETAGVACPSASEIGKVKLEVPTLPPGSLTGSIYLGGPESGPITGPPYTMYVDAESARYGVSVRLEGTVEPNPVTGRLTTVFKDNPEQPFTSIALEFKGGPYAPIASPLACGNVTATATLNPYSAPTTMVESPSSFSVTGCPTSGLEFAPTQSTSETTATAGAHPTYTLNLERPSGQEYLNTVSTTLPAGLNGAIPAVSQCTETLANTGACPASSQIGTATVLAGAGEKPYPYTGPVYLTGPYNGAPYGLSIAVPAVAGPFNLGTVVTRATINVNQETARVTVAATLPTIVGGVPLRIRKISVAIGEHSFLTNPTSCKTLASEATVTSTLGVSAKLSSPLSAANCTSLGFKPVFVSKSSAKTSKANGASLETTISQPAGESNIASVLVQLPVQLPSRLTTLQKSCPEATFAANPYSCPAGSRVGGARANTPLLPGKLTGPAYLVSHGGEAFPDLDLLLVADGVKVVLVGHTKITKGITTSDFSTLPDVPVSSITVNLPIGPNSALAVNGNVCKSTLSMPTTITAQNGKVFKQTTKIRVANCPVEVIGHRVVGDTAYITVRTHAAGRVSGRGSGLATVYRHVGGPGTVTVPVSLSHAVTFPYNVAVRIGFVPSSKALGNSVAFQSVQFG